LFLLITVIKGMSLSIKCKQTRKGEISE